MNADDLKAADLPSWVQAMRPMEAVVSDASSTIASATSDAESSGPLAGLRGVLPAGTGIEIDRKPPLYTNKLQVTDGQLKYAAQLEKMVIEEGQAKKPRHVRLSSNRLLRWVISIILISAILVPLVDGRQITPDMKLFPSEWSATTSLLDTLPASAPVLLVSDFEPALLGELQASASPVIERILVQGAQFTLISTSPTGTALASQILDSIPVDQTQPAAQVTNLGYLPGGSAGIYYFASSPQEAVSTATDGTQAWDTPALQGVGRFDDFALLLLLTDNADTGRAWIEQTRSFIGDTPILMVISAQAEPMLRPYFSSGQIQGLVTGLAGGKIYEQTYGQMGLAWDYWDSFGTGTWTAVLMMGIGSVISAGLALSSRKKGEKP